MRLIELLSCPYESLVLLRKDRHFHSSHKICLEQVFRGVTEYIDVLNHRNIDFWNHQQPAYNQRDFISCAGTNFLIRARAFTEAGTAAPLRTAQQPTSCAIAVLFADLPARELKRLLLSAYQGSSQHTL